MELYIAELKRLTEKTGFQAGLADKNGKVLYCPAGIGLKAGDRVSDADFTVIDGSDSDGTDYILFSAKENEKRSSELSSGMLKLLSERLFGSDRAGISAERLFIGALEGRPGSSEKLGSVFPKLSNNMQYRLITACCAEDETHGGQITQVREVASELFPEDQGFVTGIFNSGTGSFVSALCAVEEGDASRSEKAEQMALQLADTAGAEVMVNVRVAVSSGFRSLSRLSEMALQTVATLRLGEDFGIGSKCLVYEKTGLERLISSISEEDRLEYLRAVLGGQYWTDRSMQELLNTVSVFLQCNQNSSVTAKRMYVHRNTVNNRLEKFSRITGLDCSSFSDGVRVRIALLIIRYMGQGDPSEESMID